MDRWKLVRPHDSDLAGRLETKLISYARRQNLPGIVDKNRRTVFIEQLIESVRRIRYIEVIREQNLSPCRADPLDDRFDPIKAASFYAKRDPEEAFWLVFISTHFGRHRRSGWRLARDVYGALGRRRIWSWSRVCRNPGLFREWLDENLRRLRTDGVPRRFGNHRKYQSLDARSETGTGAAFESYVRWVNPPRTHRLLFDGTRANCKGDPRATFYCLYDSMKVVSFIRPNGQV